MTLPVAPHDPPTLGFICPSYPEFKAIQAIFDEALPGATIEETEYSYGRIGSRTAVAVHFLYGDTGPASAAKYAAQFLQDHPSLKEARSYCFLVGVAGGIWSNKSDVRLGDVLIATKIHDWRFGQMTENGFVGTKYPEQASKRLLLKLGAFLYNRELLALRLVQQVCQMRDDHDDPSWTHPGAAQDNLYVPEYVHQGSRTCGFCDSSQVEKRHARSETSPWIHDGLLASGPVVLKDTKARTTLQSAGVLAVDMEACGVPKDFIIVKGISNYADSHKNDTWHPYAAATAAACVRLMIDSFTAKPQTQKKADPLLDKSTSSAETALAVATSRISTSGSGLPGSQPRVEPVRQIGPEKAQPVKLRRRQTVP